MEAPIVARPRGAHNDEFPRIRVPRTGPVQRFLEQETPGPPHRCGLIPPSVRGNLNSFIPGRAVVLRPMWHGSGSCAGRSGAMGAIRGIAGSVRSGVGRARPPCGGDAGRVLVRDTKDSRRAREPPQASYSPAYAFWSAGMSNLAIASIASVGPRPAGPPDPAAGRGRLQRLVLLHRVTAGALPDKQAIGDERPCGGSRH